MTGDPVWICNFTYQITNVNGGALDPIFKKHEVVKQGTGPNVTLDTIDKTKVDLSPYTIRVRGWPSRQPSTVAQSLSFRVFIASGYEVMKELLLLVMKLAPIGLGAYFAYQVATLGPQLFGFYATGNRTSSLPRPQVFHAVPSFCPTITLSHIPGEGC